MGLDIFVLRKALGKEGVPIDIYKFRSMYKNSHHKLSELLSNGADSFGKPVNDPRRTSLGRILRKYWIDELPQIYNLIKGEIKLVGIRPMTEPMWEEMYPKEIRDRALKQKPGLISVQYAYPHSTDFGDNVKNIQRYLDVWEKDPIKTDLLYLELIFENIVFGGVRSH